MRVAVTGAGGFIGGHLVARLLAEGHDVKAVDIKPTKDWWQVHGSTKGGPGRVINWRSDLRLHQECHYATQNIDHVYNLACDMGGIGHIETHKADCMVSVLINTNLLRASVRNDVQRYFFASSACVYHRDRQKGSIGPLALQERDAYWNGGASPELGYGAEKLFSEQACEYFYEDHKLVTQVARFHNVYGPHGSWCDGREKAPAAICRKIAEAKLQGKQSIEVWGDGSNVRSYMYIDDCIEGIRRVMDNGNIRHPINLGSSESVTVNELIDVIEELADYKVLRDYDVHKPRGVPGRSSDNTAIQEQCGWEPTISLRDGIARTFPWIDEQVRLARGST